MNKLLKKQLHIALAALMGFSSITVTYASDYIVNDDFNNMTLGAAPQGYQSSNADAIYVVDLLNSDDYAVFLDDGEGQLKLNKKFTPQTELITVSVDFMQQQLCSGATINLTDYTGMRAVRLETRDDGRTLSYLSDGTFTKLTDITANEWINIKIEANIKTQTFNIYINDILKASNITFKNTVSEISYFQTLTAANKVGGHYIDNLTITSGKAPLTIPETAKEIMITVAANGSGDFKTVQEAIDFIPAKTALPTTIYIKEGTYNEVVTIPKNVSNLTIIGDGSDKTVLTSSHYNAELKEDGTSYGTGGSASTFIKGSNISIEGVAFENAFKETGANGEQAVALSVTGTNVQFKNCSFLGNQDTLLLDGGTQYFTDCYVEGDVDFIFGRSQAVFENCQIHSLNRGSSSNNGYIVAPRTSINEPYGFAFINCQLTGEDGIADQSVYLGRPWCPSGISVDKASTAFINCEMGSHIKTEGWTSMSNVPASHGRFFEYQSTGTGANAARPQLTDEEAANWTVLNVLKGWEPSFSVNVPVTPDEDLVTPPAPEKIYFSDVTSTDSYFEDIMLLANSGYVNGIGNGQFGPHQQVTRSQFVTILSRILKLETASSTSAFKDVNTNAWYFNAVQACYEAGLIKGVSQTEFAPDAKITKQDMMLLLSRALHHLSIAENPNGSTSAFIDADKISDYALEGVQSCINAGLIKAEGYFMPKSLATRGNMASMFVKVLQLAQQ